MKHQSDRFYGRLSYTVPLNGGNVTGGVGFDCIPCNCSLLEESTMVPVLGKPCNIPVSIVT